MQAVLENDTIYMLEQFQFSVTHIKINKTSISKDYFWEALFE